MHPHEICEDCYIKRCQKRHLYSCKYVNLESGCARGGLCDFSHRNKPTVIDKEGCEGSIEVDLIESSQDESKTKRLGVGMFGWVPRRIDSSVSMETSKDQHLLSQKVQRVHLLMNMK